jgi:acid phosphatase family membrane protein YuiD
MLSDLFSNQVLGPTLLGWFLAQILKPFTHYIRVRRWNWGLFFSAGGMPSSHSALITSVTFAIGFQIGFDSPLFALALAIGMIVVYDAAGVRRQAGLQAQRINLLINEIFAGKPISEERLKEVLGHTPTQVLAGILLGFMVALLYYLFTKA